MGRRGRELADVLVREGGSLEIRALYSRTKGPTAEARRHLVRLYQARGRRQEISLHTSLEDLVRDPRVELVVVCTPQYAHREPALAVLQGGKSVCLDKPLAHTLKDAIAIHDVAREAEGRMMMSFTRRFERTWIEAHRLSREEQRIGSVRMILLRNVLPAHIYFHTWHRQRALSGGALADRMSHAFDVFEWFSGSRPVRLSAFAGRGVFRPWSEAPGGCRDCGRDCPYRIAEAGSRAPESSSRDDVCVWYPGADIYDHGLLSLEYAGGLKASLFWSLFGPSAEDEETMELVGDRGRLRLERRRRVIDLISEYGARHEVLDYSAEEPSTDHFGADRRLVRELEAFGRGAPPRVTETDGLAAARIVEAAHRSIAAGGIPIDMSSIPGGRNSE
jgi:predicted dehydrogenase